MTVGWQAAPEILSFTCLNIIKCKNWEEIASCVCVYVCVCVCLCVCVCVCVCVMDVIRPNLGGAEAHT